jgi:hypothetical protein
MHESLEVIQADIAGQTLDVKVEPMGTQFFVELVLPPLKGAKRTVPMVIHSGHVGRREDVSDWIIEVAPQVAAKIQSAQRYLAFQQAAKS